MFSKCLSKHVDVNLALSAFGFRFFGGDSEGAEAADGKRRSDAQLGLGLTPLSKSFKMAAGLCGSARGRL